ncbi:GfdT protein [Pseudorhodobacter sp. E13]|uniref:FIST N-terminal domain-containing protein n=1 Tax=Pseudorhodobacter sp. E13 TaxID=2487931 RepID=UPI000F8E43E7|nr:FIST N-terminal domain-containing protein [Pseudorhodobacter sp. E13]RUS60489.1 GfdT protein [Pseudorhodobacter sp. E13]
MVQSEGPLLARAHVAADEPQALATLAAGLGPGPFALVILFLSPQAPLAALAAQSLTAFGDTPVIGCTTAGEISANGYAEGSIVAIGLPRAHFVTDPILIPDLSTLNRDQLIGQLIRARQALSAKAPHWAHEFGFLLVDGLSLKEDELAFTLASGLGPVPFFGGSAGDGTDFGQTFILHQGKICANAAVLALIRSDCRAHVFKLDHLHPSARRMVVTSATPAARVVHQINAEPAAQEYARLLGKDPSQLTPFTFAAHPVLVRIGGQHHVRAIRQVAPNGDLIFFSAIDEGLVLTLAEPQDMVSHLSAGLEALSRGGTRPSILACDCLLRRVEAQEKQMTGAISKLLRGHGVTGFSTYGEQMGGMHVNQTLTGVALYPPGS